MPNAAPPIILHTSPDSEASRCPSQKPHLVDGRLHGRLERYVAAIDQRADRLKSCRGTRRDKSHAGLGVSVHARGGHITASYELQLQMPLSTRCTRGAAASL